MTLRRRGRPQRADLRRRPRPRAARLRRGALPGAVADRRGRRGADRQFDLSRHPDLPPPPDPARRRLPGLGPVQGRRPADLPAAAVPDGPALCAERHWHAADRPLRRQDDRGRGADRRGRLPLAGRLVPAQVASALGAELDDHFRLWFVDKAMHTGPFPSRSEPRPARTTRTVPYVGVLQQALRDLAAWVEQGLPRRPAPNTQVVDGQVQVPPTAAARKGIQPVVRLTANGAERAEVAVGETVPSRRASTSPPGLAWWWRPSGTSRARATSRSRRRSSSSAPTGPASRSRPATPSPSPEPTSRRSGPPRSGRATPRTRFARVQNLGRVRVVVT